MIEGYFVNEALPESTVTRLLVGTTWIGERVQLVFIVAMVNLDRHSVRRHQNTLTMHFSSERDAWNDKLGVGTVTPYLKFHKRQPRSLMAQMIRDC